MRFINTKVALLSSAVGAVLSLPAASSGIDGDELKTAALYSSLKEPALTNSNQIQLISTAIHGVLMSETLPSLPAAGRWHKEHLADFYDNRSHEPVWFDGSGQVRSDILAWLGAFDVAEAEGLNRTDYQFKAILSSYNKALPPRHLALIDMQLTNSLLHLIKDLSVGRANPSKIFPTLFLLEQNREYSDKLEQIINLSNENEIKDGLRRFAPQHPQYAQLRSALLRYTRLLDATGGFEDIETEGLIKAGDIDARLPLIRERMRLLGRLDGQQQIIDSLEKRTLLAGSSEESSEQADHVYDSATETAIRQFQDVSGAKVDGVIGPETIEELNTPLQDRIEQIRLSMERWRWLPQDLGDKYVFTNIAGFYVHGVEDGKIVVNSPVIVGKAAHQTPAFSSIIENIKFYPDWTVPYSISRRYLLNKIQKNPDVIQELGYEIYEGHSKLDWENVELAKLTWRDFPKYTFRQRPGPSNALGLVRFSIKNDYSIYMHDTPDVDLFDEDRRAFSSGCIRVENYEKLAAFLMDQNSALSRQEIMEKFIFQDQQQAEALETEIVPLRQSIPVHLVYMTAWVNEAGDLRFEHDIYGRDKKLIQALKRQEGSF